MGSFYAALLDALLSAGVSDERARAVVDLFDRSVDERYSLHAQVLATKRDVAELETRLVREIAERDARLTRELAETHGRLEARITQIVGRIAEVDGRIAEVDGRITQVEGRIAQIEGRITRIEGRLGRIEVRIAETKADLIKWTLGALTAQTALLLGAIKVF